MKIEPGRDFTLVGNGPTYEEFQMMAAGLITEKQTTVSRHRFYFIIHRTEALIVWFNQNKFYQKRLPLDRVAGLLMRLQQQGFREEQSN